MPPRGKKPNVLRKEESPSLAFSDQESSERRNSAETTSSGLRRRNSATLASGAEERPHNLRSNPNFQGEAPLLRRPSEEDVDEIGEDSVRIGQHRLSQDHRRDRGPCSMSPIRGIGEPVRLSPDPLPTGDAGRRGRHSGDHQGGALREQRRGSSLNEDFVMHPSQAYPAAEASREEQEKFRPVEAQLQGSAPLVFFHPADAFNEHLAKNSTIPMLHPTLIFVVLRDGLFRYTIQSVVEDLKASGEQRATRRMLGSLMKQRISPYFEEKLRIGVQERLFDRLEEVARRAELMLTVAQTQELAEQYVQETRYMVPMVLEVWDALITDGANDHSVYDETAKIVHGADRSSSQWDERLHELSVRREAENAISSEESEQGKREVVEELAVQNPSDYDLELVEIVTFLEQGHDLTLVTLKDILVRVTAHLSEATTDDRYNSAMTAWHAVTAKLVDIRGLAVDRPNAPNQGQRYSSPSLGESTPKPSSMRKEVASPRVWVGVRLAEHRD
jgi:hypothetical protein